MAKQEVTGVQIQMAAAAGCKLLQVDDLSVPLSISKGGALGILEGMLQALAQGEVVIMPAPDPNAPQPNPAVAKGVKKALTPGSDDPPAANSEDSVATPAEETLPDDDDPAVEEAQG